jgi:tetratricopeptide (TPR) repeat protein
MKRNFLFFVSLFLMSFFCNLTTVEAKVGQGISYYKAGFPQVAKPLLLNDYVNESSAKDETCFNLGNIYFEENKLDSAAYYFNKGLVANPLNSLNSIGLNMLKIKSDPATAELEFQKIVKQKENKKNIDVYIAIANAYLSNNMIDKALLYQGKAKDVKTKYAPLYVLLGDIELAKKNIGTACSNYELGIYYDDKCKEAYIKYARAYRNVNTPLAIEKLNVLKTKEPTFLLADKELADIYYSINNFDKAAQLYEVYLKSGNSNVMDLTKYAFTLFLNGQFEKSLEVTNIGLSKAPANPALNRLSMYNNVDLKHTEAALKAADLFFNKSEKPEFTYLDYRYYGQALRDSKQIDLAIPQFEKALQIDSLKTELWKDISDMYSDKSDFVKSISAYTNYLNSLPVEKRDADAMMPLAKYYYSLGNDAKVEATVKKGYLVKADSIFAIIAIDEPTAYRGNFWRGRTNSALDPEATQGLAKPFYEKTVTLLESKADPRYNSVLSECYSYLGYYYLLQKDNTLSLTYWNKILAIDPTNVTAKKASEGITKAMKGKK